MSKNPVVAKKDASLQDIVSLMTEKAVGSVIITDDELPSGIVTERELLKELVTHGSVRRDVKAEEIMASSIFQLEPESSIEEAARNMISKKARLVVTRGGKLVGVLTASDLMRAFSRGGKDLPIEGVISPKVETLDAVKSVKDAVQLMHQRRIGSVLVAKKGKPFGIFTERDLLTKILRGEKGLDAKLEDVASKPLITADSSVSAKKAASIMQSKKIKRLPLMKGERLVGIVTARDLVEAFSKP